MGTIELRLQNLETDDLVNAEFASDVDALIWLKERPRMVAVLGLATPGLPPELIAALKAATRPLDEEERELSRQIDERRRALIEKQMAAEQARARAEGERRRAAINTGDPNRPMSLRWTLEDGVRNADPDDDREVTEAVREAVLAWVRERDEWVKDRGLVVGEALVSAWPAALPAAADGQRVQRGGTFTPTTPPAPPKP